ncbi:MAG: hypothetical protein LUE17_08195 [Planctomycetaceae bacterium]|nr:hypothetical protein [Planctomycetaceae bacterium]
MRTLLALALALGMFAVSGCGSCGDDVCYAPPAPRIASNYCAPVEPLAPLPTSAIAPVIGPDPIIGSGDVMPAVIPSHARAGPVYSVLGAQLLPSGPVLRGVRDGGILA